MRRKKPSNTKRDDECGINGNKAKMNQQNKENKETRRNCDKEKRTEKERK